MQVKIINLTQHAASPEQVTSGVVDVENREELCRLLTFEEKPRVAELALRAQRVAELAGNAPFAMIGGAPFFMSCLENALADRGVTSLYSFSARVVEEKTLPDGSVEKKSRFKHLGFIQGRYAIALKAEKIFQETVTELIESGWPQDEAIREADHNALRLGEELTLALVRILS